MLPKQETSARSLEPTDASLVGEPNAGEGMKDLEDILSKAAVRERQSRKRAIVYTLVLVIIGVVFLTVSLVKVSRLQQTATNLNGQIESKTEELQRKRDELSTLETKKQEADDHLKIATTTLNEINKNPQNAQQKAREALQLVNKPTTEKDSPGFIDNNNFKGPAQTSIKIEIIPDKALLDSPTRPHTLFTYQIDGEQTHDASGQTSFPFSLDRSKVVMLIFDFDREGSGGYTIKQTTNAGRIKTKQFHIDPKVQRVGRSISLHFSVE